MKRLRWQIVIVFLALVAIGVLLLGQQPQILPGLEPPEEQPSSGGIYVEGVIGSPGRLNPLFDWSNTADREINRLLYNSLVRFDQNGIPQAELADSWGISQDGKIYNFLLRDSVWHDGEPITADDVAFTVNLLRNDVFPFPADLREFWNKVEVEVVDEKIVQFQLPDAFAPFLDFLTFSVIPKHIWENVPPEEIVNSPLNLNPVGSGPYRFSKYFTSEGQITGVELAVFNGYFKKIPFIETVVFIYFQDAASALDAYRQGGLGGNFDDIDRINGIGYIPQDLLTEAFELSDLNIYSGLMPKLNLVLVNLDDPKALALQDINVRQALYQGLNRQGIVDQLLMGQAVIADGPIFPASWAYYQDLPQIDFNPDAAIALLREAGYTIPAEGGNVRSKEGVNLDFNLVFPDNQPYTEIAKMIQKDWERLGVKINLTPATEDQLITNYLTPRNFQLALVELNGMDFADPDPYTFWHQTQIKQGQNFSGWNDRKASELLEQGRTEADITARTPLYRNFQVRFMQELPSLPLFFPVYTFAVDKEIRGVRVGPFYTPSDRFTTISDWYLITRFGTDILPTETPEP